MSAYSFALQALLARFAASAEHGLVATPVPGVQFFWARHEVARTPIVYGASLCFVCQGHKTGYRGDRSFRYDAGHYLLVSLACPFECAASGSMAQPLAGIVIDLDPRTLAELVAAAGPGHRGPANALAVQPVAMDAAMRAGVDRLLAALTDEEEARILGAGLVREIVFRALRGPGGEVLRALLDEHAQTARIARALARIQRDHAERLSVGILAKEAGMSSSLFHRSFRAATGITPLQYLKEFRLNRAKSLIALQQVSVTEAALGVGYANAAHFSRDFKRYFGLPPSRATEIGYSYIPQ